MRYIIIDSEVYEGQTYRVVYDTLRKHFSIVQKQIDGVWKSQSFVNENFYVFFPGFAKNSRYSNRLPKIRYPNWN